MERPGKQQQFGWGGKREGAGRPRHTDELPHVVRPEFRPGHPQQVTIRFRPGLISQRESESIAAIEDALQLTREHLGVRLCHFAVFGDYLHLIVEAEDRTALGQAMKGMNVRIARALNRLLNRKGRVIADRYHVRALKTPAEVRQALSTLRRKAREHGLTTSWAHRDLAAAPRSSLLRSGVRRSDR